MSQEKKELAEDACEELHEIQETIEDVREIFEEIGDKTGIEKVKVAKRAVDDVTEYIEKRLDN